MFWEHVEISISVLVGAMPEWVWNGMVPPLWSGSSINNKILSDLCTRRFFCAQEATCWLAELVHDSLKTQSGYRLTGQTSLFPTLGVWANTRGLLSKRTHTGHWAYSLKANCGEFRWIWQKVCLITVHCWLSLLNSRRVSTIGTSGTFYRTFVCVSTWQGCSHRAVSGPTEYLIGGRYSKTVRWELVADWLLYSSWVMLFVTCYSLV